MHQNVHADPAGGNWVGLYCFPSVSESQQIPVAFRAHYADAGHGGAGAGGGAAGHGGTGAAHRILTFNTAAGGIIDW